MAYDPNDKEDKKIVAKLIADAIAEAETEHETAVQGLKTKNGDLIKELREARNGKGKPEDIAALETQLETANTELAKLNKAHTKVTKELEETSAAKETETKYAQDLLIEGQLTEHLLANKIVPEFMPAVKSLLKPQATVKVDDKGRAVVVGDKSLGDFVKEWSLGDQGKVFVGAPLNSGGGAGGNRQPNNGSGGKTMTRAAYDAAIVDGSVNVSKFFAEGGSLTD